MTRNYSALAPFYDKIMAHVEYDQWVSYIKKIISLYTNVSVPAIFEIGGGTGVLGEKILRAGGLKYQGSDLSFKMCCQALKRGLPFFVADARFLPLKKSNCFDMVIFLYDGINYLQSLDEYRQTFTRVHSYLKTQGFFLFDITTTANSLKNFNEFIDTGDFNEHFFFRRSYYHPDECMQYNDFTIFSKQSDGYAVDTPCLFQKFAEHHAQKVFPVVSIRDAIPRDLFHIIGIWEDFSFKHFTSRSERVHFLLKKADG
jgi:ubiquinone/menaquinone biosynthesis C-methylase UbiE